MTREPRGRARAVLVTVLLAVLAVGLGAWVASARLPGDDASTAAPAPTAPVPPAPVTPAAGPTTPAPTAPPLPLTGRTVVLDPGHNRDNGSHPSEIGRPVDAGGFPKACNTTGTATNGGVPEATVNWELALAVRQRLEAAGARVVLTRDADAGWGPCIDERAAIANREDADLLLSLHADGAAASAHGFHVITPGVLPGWTDDIAAESARAAVVTRDSLGAAGLVPATYTGVDGIDERTDLGTLNRSDVPAVMLEAGNLRNDGDAALLTGDEGRARVAGALATAVVTYLSGGR